MNSNDQTADTTSQTDWVKTPVANLVRYKPSGIYFARARIRGKLFRQSLKTDLMSVAKLRLRDFIKHRPSGNKVHWVDRGHGTRARH